MFKIGQPTPSQQSDPRLLELVRGMPAERAQLTHVPTR